MLFKASPWAANMSAEHRGDMSAFANPMAGERTAAAANRDRRRSALTAILVLAGMSSLVLLGDLRIGPSWVHWLGSLIAVVAALGVVVIVELSWDRAIDTAKSVGLVALETRIS